jgi:ribosome-associated toxin RatA of RatAB toxin-antitoxin module
MMNRGLDGSPRVFHGQAADVTRASLEESFVLVSAVDRYPDWCPDIVREVEVFDRGTDGHPSRVRMRMRVARGAIVREFDLYLVVAVEPPSTVDLTRTTDHPTNQEFNATWMLSSAGSTTIALELDAKLRVPWYIRSGGIGDAIAEAFVSAASRRLAMPSH